MKEKISKKIAKGAVSVLDTFLRVDANSAACCIAYQPKAPKELASGRVVWQRNNYVVKR